ncbi:hypothetical protein J1N35_009289 [Gossypium stocksii]|uniref:Uncharacterized protein n=1 Tax=Gossypium stocksii TaxID=47602 RepID=A0A9D3VY94_9ROSI|nr:hypothetical protein J1N35_009289 [Gossypium stocksii]
MKRSCFINPQKTLLAHLSFYTFLHFLVYIISSFTKKMCYATVPSAGKHGSAVRRRLLVLQASLIAVTTARHAPRTGVTRDQRAGSMVKGCLCSPTKHPGSFRCRHHIAEYAWGARFVGKK